MFRKKVFMPEQIERGIESFPAAMVNMFTGGHIGKLLVDVKGDESSMSVESKKTL
jgi:NADPH-dependent curcumin reductase CurA